MRESAAAYGAQAVVDIAIFLKGSSTARFHSASGWFGPYLTGRAVVYDQSGQEPQSPAMPQAITKPIAQR